MDEPDWLPSGIDWRRPSAARVHDVYLGGSHNFAVDRDVAAELVRIMPEVPEVLRANRSYLRRAVRHLVHSGIRQFLDLASGIPTVGCVHEIAQALDPGCRVVYVDSDPVAVAHSRDILGGNPNTAAVRADLRDRQSLLTDPTVTGLLNLAEPIAVLMVMSLHYVSDADDPAAIVRGYLDAVAPGSYLVLSHATLSQRPEGVVRIKEAVELYSQQVDEVYARDSSAVTALFDTLDLITPGAVPADLWHPETPPDPDDSPVREALLCAVARKSA